MMSCLDHIFVKKKSKMIGLDLKSFIINTDITDHLPVMLNISSLVAAPTTIGENRRYYDHIDYQKFKEDLSSMDWQSVLNSDNAEVACEYFLKIYTETLNRCTSKRFSKSEPKKIKDWITSGLIKSIRYRDKLKKKLLKSHSIQLENEYKIYRNFLNKLIKKRKLEYYRNQIENNGSNMKKIYRIIDDATNVKNNKDLSDLRILKDNKQEFEDNVSMANFCNNYFINIGKEMAKKIDTPPMNLTLQGRVGNSMYLRPVTEN